MRVKQTNITAQRGHKLKDIVQRHAMHVSYSEKILNNIRKMVNLSSVMR